MVQAAFPFALPASALPRSVQAPFNLLSPTRPAGSTSDHRPVEVDTQAASSAGFDGIGFQIGWDHAHHRLTPPLAHLHASSPVRQGWSAGRAVFGARTLAAGLHVRRWLTLRLQAWQHGQAVEDVQVTPHLLARLAGAECPVMRQPLAQDDAAQANTTVVMRLNPAAAYAAGNLVLVDAAVDRAREGADCQTMLTHAQRVADHPPQACVRGLDVRAWQRLAVLTSFATPLPHGLVATLPLVVLPPRRVRVINPAQALQVVLTLQFAQAGYARRLLTWAALMPDSEARQAFQIFMHTLLARRLAVGQALDGATLRRAMEDSWLDPLVQRRWQRLALWLTPEACERLLQRAHRRGLCVGGGRWISDAAATEGWQIDA